jgi:hypothetical protein
MTIETDVADEIIRQDKSFAKFRMKNGNILVRLNKVLYGCIESAKLWYEEIAGTLKSNGFYLDCQGCVQYADPISPTSMKRRSAAAI